MLDFSHGGGKYLEGIDYCWIRWLFERSLGWNRMDFEFGSVHDVKICAFFLSPICVAAKWLISIGRFRIPLS